MPAVAAARHGRGVTLGRNIDRQVQRNGAVARARTFDGAAQNRIANRSDNLKAVIHIILTGTNTCFNIGNGLSANGKVQNHDAVAAKSSVQRQLVVTRLRNIETVLVVCFAHTNLLVKFRRIGLVNRKNQYSGVKAGVGIFTIVNIRAGNSVGGVRHGPIELGAAGIHRLFRIIAVVDCQVQINGAVASSGEMEYLLIVARNGVSAIIPMVGATICDRVKFLRHRIDSEVQDYNAVAAVTGVQRQVVVTSFGHIEAILAVCFALTNLCGEFRRSGFV